MSFNTQMKVLIVDDHKTMLRIVRNLLAQINITNVEEACDGQDALRKLTQGKYDLVLSDWNMLPMTGLELLKCVRNDQTYGHRRVPFIMITAESRPENIKEAKDAGTDNYIIKPFNADVLEHKIKLAIAQKAA